MQDQAPARTPARAGRREQAPTAGPGGRPPARISATPAAREAIRRLRAARGGALMFVQSAGCCAGSVPMCFPAGEYLVGDTDLLLGIIEGCPFYIDARTYQSWDHPQLVLDIAPGNPEGFSLGPGSGLHFVTRASACPLPGSGKPVQASPACRTLVEEEQR